MVKFTCIFFLTFEIAKLTFPTLTYQVASPKIQFSHLESQKQKFNVTIDLLSLGIHAPGLHVLTNRPQISRGGRI